MDETILERDKFEEWLKIPENYRQIKKISSGIYNKMKLKRLSVPGVDIFLSEKKIAEGSQSDDICQELFLFLLEKPEIQKKLLQNDKSVFLMIRKYFFNHIIDQIRCGKNNQDIYKDTWRLFYRHVLDVLGHSENFYGFKIHGKNICFSMSSEEPEKIVLSEDLPDVDFPDDTPANFHEVNKKKNILRLAVYFWKECSKATKDPYIRINIIDFISWIGGYVPLQSRVESDWQTAEQRENNTDKNFTDSFTESLPDSESEENSEQTALKSIKYTQIKTWAKNFFHMLLDKEKKIFYYYECEALKNSEISKLMGKKANQSYQKEKVLDKLREFLRPLDWVSPESGRKNEKPDFDAFLFFRDELCRMLGIEIKANPAACRN